MTDGECVAFLQWALPRLGLRWPGFRRVRGQVRKRLARRLEALGLPDLAAYRARLEAGDEVEWRALDALCRITISRFWRDRRVFARLADDLLPPLAREARARGAPLACWSAGCASGEEPYTLALLWDRVLAPAAPGVTLRVLATDVDAAVLARARRACYPPGSLRDLPAGWADACFTRAGDEACLAPRLRDVVELRQTDLRRDLPDETFDLVLCRNLAFTYFDEPGQRAALARLLGRLRPGGVLVIGRKERLPPAELLTPLGDGLYRLPGVSAT
ncbi:MAG: methyltransferase domain-containing protein [Planctomycetes bacterium]|nr:methyltransferase domain-containing protein [Planctomycetota bacterium]